MTARSMEYSAISYYGQPEIREGDVLRHIKSGTFYEVQGFWVGAPPIRATYAYLTGLWSQQKPHRPTRSPKARHLFDETEWVRAERREVELAVGYPCPWMDADGE